MPFFSLSSSLFSFHLFAHFQQQGAFLFLFLPSHHLLSLFTLPVTSIEYPHLKSSTTPSDQIGAVKGLITRLLGIFLLSLHPSIHTSLTKNTFFAQIAFVLPSHSLFSRPVSRLSFQSLYRLFLPRFFSYFYSQPRFCCDKWEYWCVSCGWVVSLFEIFLSLRCFLGSKWIWKSTPTSVSSPFSSCPRQEVK